MSSYIVVLLSKGIKLLTVLIHKHTEKGTLYYNEIRWLQRNWRQSDIWVRYHWELRDNNFVYGPDLTHKNLPFFFFLSCQENLYWSIPSVMVLKSILRIVEDPKPKSRFETWCWHPSSVHFSCVQLFVNPWTAASQASLSITNSWSLLKLMSIESVMLSNHLILCHPLLLPSIFPSIRVFSNDPFLLISWLQSPSAVILEPKKIKFITVSIAPCWCRFDNRWAARHKGIPWVLLLVKGCSPRMSCADGFYKKMESKWSTTQMRKTEAIYSELVEVKRVNHHHLHLADSQSQAVKWERFIV